MRKAMILLLLLCVLSISVVCVAAVGIYNAHDQVVLTEQAVYGDSSAAHGLTVQINTTYNDRLLWDTTYRPDEPSFTHTDYRFSAYRVNESSDPSYSGLLLESGVSAGIHNFDPNLQQTGLMVAFRELYDSLEPGEEGSTTIRIGDYIDYYPLAVFMDFPGGRQTNLEPYLFSDLDFSDESMTFDEPYVLYRLQQYLKIPVLEDEYIDLSVRKYEQGNHWGTGCGTSDRGDFYYMGSVSAITEDAVYFTFHTRTNKGRLVDTSQLEDGYGIYRLPFDPGYYDEDGTHIVNNITGVDVDGLEMVYPLDPSVQIQDMHLSPDQTKLLLHSIENGMYVLTVIDMATMEPVQRLELVEWMDDDLWRLYDEGDFLVVQFYGSEKFLLIAEHDGHYTLKYICNMRPEDAPDFEVWYPSLDFDGEKLVISQQLRNNTSQYREETCDFYLAVYDRTGLLYYGEYLSSLSTGVVNDYSFYCSGRSNALQVRWD